PRLLSLRHLPHPRALHSFPTRRSSDLAAVGISRGLRSRQRHVEDRVVREYGERGEQQRARRRFQNRRSDAELGFSFHFSSLLSRVACRIGAHELYLPIRLNVTGIVPWMLKMPPSSVPLSVSVIAAFHGSTFGNVNWISRPSTRNSRSGRSISPSVVPTRRALIVPSPLSSISISMSRSIVAMYGRPTQRPFSAFATSAPTGTGACSGSGVGFARS